MADEPIRVLRLIARLNVGGPALHVTYLTDGLATRGYETKLVAGRVGEGEGSMEYAVRERGIEPIFMPALQREVSPLHDTFAVHRLRELIREFRPHVLHTHTAKAGAVGRAAAVLAGDARPPAVVHTFHGHVLRGYFGAAQTQFFRRLESRLAKVSDALIAVSPQVRDDLVRLGVAPADKISVIRLGLDLDARTLAEPGARERVRERLGLPEERFVVGWLGRMTAIKRVDDLLQAFALLRRERDADLLLVGDGPLRPGLERLARELGVYESTHFLGYTDDVAELFAAVDAVALTSANEGTPVTLIESLAAGRPVVSTDVGGVADVVGPSTGFLTAPGDTEAVAARLYELAVDPELRQRLGDAGRSSVRERYAIPRLLDDVDELYRGLLAQAEPRHKPLAEALTPTLPTRRVPPAPRRLRVILVSQYFPPEVGATQTRMQAFAEHLAARGHEVTVIAEFPSHPHGVIPERYRGHLVDDDRSNPYRVLRVWVRTSHEKTQKTRMALYLSYMTLATGVAPLAGRADVVVATSPPLFAGIAGLAIARMNGAPFVLDVRDLWPAAAVSLGQISTGRTLVLAEALERRLYRSAAAVVAVTRPFCDHVDAIRGRPPRTALIPNGTLELFLDANGALPREELGARSGRLLVMFAGTHGIAQALPSVLDAAPLVEDVADFAFVGEGPLKASLVAQAEERALTNVSFHAQRPLDEMPPVLAASDALLVPLSGHPTFRDFVPSKMIDFMAAGRPVILSAAGEAARLLTASGAGAVVEPENPQALAAAVRRLAEHPEEGAEMGRRGRAFAARRLRSVQAERLEALLLDVTRR